LVVFGTASERPCRNAPAASRRKEHVKHVWVAVYRGVGHGRCRFLRPSGRLTRRRACFKHPVEFRASGTGRWHLRRRLHLAAGRYVVRADAVDGFRRHQRRRAVSTFRSRLR
jgi:hypothetical protein